MYCIQYQPEFNIRINPLKTAMYSENQCDSNHLGYVAQLLVAQWMCYIIISPSVVDCRSYKNEILGRYK